MNREVSDRLADAVSFEPYPRLKTNQSDPSDWQFLNVFFFSLGSFRMTTIFPPGKNNILDVSEKWWSSWASSHSRSGIGHGVSLAATCLTASSATETKFEDSAGLFPLTICWNSKQKEKPRLLKAREDGKKRKGCEVSMGKGGAGLWNFLRRQKIFSEGKKSLRGFAERCLEELIHFQSERGFGQFWTHVCFPSSLYFSPQATPASILDFFSKSPLSPYHPLSLKGPSDFIPKPPPPFLLPCSKRRMPHPVGHQTFFLLLVLV